MREKIKKATAGPWRVASYKTMNSGNHVILSPYKGPDDPHPVIASVKKRPGYSANAHLIAAAPDLLGACRECLKVVDECYAATGHVRVSADSEQRRKIVTAIARAEGKTP